MEAYHDADERTTDSLNPRHRRILEEGSAIGPDVIAARGVRTVSKPADLPAAFSPRQKRRAPGMLFTVHRPNGQQTHVFRPDETPPDKPGWKYEQIPARNGGGNVLDIHPFCQEWKADRDVSLYVVEGTKKADSLVTALRGAGERGVVVASVGVWNWRHRPDGMRSEPIPDMWALPVKGRRVVIVFDSDMLRKWQVQLAARELAEHLQDRGAQVEITFFRDAPDGSKVGADDFFAAGGTLEEMRRLTRPYDPGAFRLIRLSRDERLRAALADLARRFWEHPWSGMGGYSARDVLAVAIEHAADAGEMREDGVSIRLAKRAWMRRAGVSSRTFYKCLDRLEAAGLGYRDQTGRKAEETGGFVLRASVNHYGTKPVSVGEAQAELEGLYAGGLHLRAPRLRWSSPGSKGRRGVAKGTRRVRQGQRPARDPIKRPGKIRGAWLDGLDKLGGRASVAEVCALLKRKRPGDDARRVLPMLLETGIVLRAGDVLTLADGWLELLEELRVLGREPATEARQREHHHQEYRAHRAALAAGRREWREIRRRAEEARTRPGPTVRQWQGRREDLEDLGQRLRSGTAHKRPLRRRRAPLVHGVYVHRGECACEWCAA